MIEEDSNPESDKKIDVQNKNLQLKDETEKEMDSPQSFNDTKAFRMMQMMGYKQGLGLGKNKQGITLPIDVKSQLGTRGLGLQIKNLEASEEQWDFSLENLHIEEKVEWLENQHTTILTHSELSKWSLEAKPRRQIEEEHNFCDSDLLHKVITGKNIFDELDLKELNQARAKANPFETVRSVFFMNRAALKMANIDAATDFLFTNIDKDSHHRQNEGPYYFADVCAGPGGFTEYILWRKKWLFKGFGLTLRDENDFKVAESTCASPVTFLPLYGARGDGDVCCPDNIRDFKQKVLHETGGQGVHFMMSDGGFSVDGNENLQEILSKNIYIAQCLVALEILRPHGHFVTKLFDVFTQFSVGLLYLMYRCFHKVAILKPNSSRPANSERYFICAHLKDNEIIKDIRQYLKNLVRRLWQLKNDPELDIVEIVPLEIIKKDTKFFDYIYKSNNKLAEKQTISLRKLAVFCRNPLNVDVRQEELRKKCLQYWQIPDKPKAAVQKLTVDELLSETIDKRELLLVQPREVSNKIDNLREIVSDLDDWHFVPMQCTKLTNICNFYAGVGMSKTYRLQSNKWVRVKNLHLVRGTLLYGELVKEQSIFNSLNETQTYSLHVIDALRLGDLSLADLKFEERRQLIYTYCKAINHEFRQNSIRIRQKYVEPLSNLNFGGLTFENGSYRAALTPMLGFDIQKESYEVNSILLLKTNENQSFHSTYVLRLQIFLSQNENDEENCISLDKLNKSLQKVH